jgi:glycosyltransferase involved in cell wall biosynthesis
MSKVETTYIIPSRNERWMPNTVNDILENSTGSIQVVVILEGYWPKSKDLSKDPRVIYIHNGEPKGMRTAISQGAAIADGIWLIKIDAHCRIDRGMDQELIKHAQWNTVQIPRRKRLDAENWCEQIQENPLRKPPVDYEFLCFPDEKNGDFVGATMNGKIWTERILERQDIPVDEVSAFQGSCWHMSKKFFDVCGFMNEEIYGDFFNESQEIVFNTYLAQESHCQVVKTTSYQHLHKGRDKVTGADGRTGRAYRLRESSLQAGRAGVMRFYDGEKVLKNQKRPLSFLLEKFMPIPTWDLTKIEELKERERKHGWNV